MKKGFTVLELMVVIVIISILTSVVLAVLTDEKKLKEGGVPVGEQIGPKS
jgi:prepilin-type N-terminal cleavage/methylation domain-containing protein